MMTFRFGATDLVNIRFAISPLTELWQSVRALQNPDARALHLPWLAETKRKLGDLDLELLYALQPARGISPDFIHPPPTSPSVDFECELSQMLSTSAEQIRREISALSEFVTLPPRLESALRRPEIFMSSLSELLPEYWRRALAPHWDRVRASLENDIFYRARASADGGAQALFADLHQSVSYQDARLHIDKPWDCSADLSGNGLLLMPSTFVWPAMVVIDEPPWQPSIIYPARGTAELWEPSRSVPAALAALVGGRRASVLESLDAPRSTTELARRLDVTAASVSQHLAVLRAAGLVRRRRVGRVVLYDRTDLGELLANGADQEAAA